MPSFLFCEDFQQQFSTYFSIYTSPELQDSLFNFPENFGFFRIIYVSIKTTSTQDFFSLNLFMRKKRFKNLKNLIFAVFLFVFVLLFFLLLLLSLLLFFINVHIIHMPISANASIKIYITKVNINLGFFFVCF